MDGVIPFDNPICGGPSIRHTNEGEEGSCVLAVFFFPDDNVCDELCLPLQSWRRIDPPVSTNSLLCFFPSGDLEEYGSLSVLTLVGTFRDE